MEARVGIEPTMQLLQSRALPLGYPAPFRLKLVAQDHADPGNVGVFSPRVKGKRQALIGG